MAESNNNLESLLQSKLDESPAPLELDKDWLKLESILDVKSFLTFRWNHFNMYYLGSILATMCMAGTALYLSLNQPQFDSTNTQFTRTDTVYVDRVMHDTILVASNSMALKGNAKMTLISQKTNELKPTNILPTIDSIKTNVPVERVPHSTPVASKEQDVVKKPVVYQFKRDTIVKYDSIKISKREHKRMQKKQ